jgi:hypothetical protein
LVSFASIFCQNIATFGRSRVQSGHNHAERSGACPCPDILRYPQVNCTSPEYVTGTLNAGGYGVKKNKTDPGNKSGSAPVMASSADDFPAELKSRYAIGLYATSPIAPAIQDDPLMETD